MESNVVWLRGFLIPLLIVFNFTLVHCEDNPLDRVPISLLKFQLNLNRSVSCNESMKEARTFYARVCPDSQEIIYPQAKTFVIQGNNRSICLTNTSQEIRPDSLLPDKIYMNFTNCAIVSAPTLVANPLNYSFNSSCALPNHFAHLPNTTNELALAVLTCPKLSRGKKYCLVFVPSKLRNNLSRVCPSGRTLHGLPASPQPSVSSVSSVTHPTTSKPIKTSIFDKISAFIKNRTVLFGAIVAVVFVVMIVIIGICCWRCYKGKRDSSNLELEPLPPSGDDKKASAESVVYQEPDINSVPASEIVQSTGDYEYAYSHQVRGNKIPDKKKFTENHYENSEVVDGKEREYTSLRRSGSEANEPEYQRLSSSSPQHGRKEKPLPLYYVKVL